jgi:hypothetical protein
MVERKKILKKIEDDTSSKRGFSKFAKDYKEKSEMTYRC